MTFAQTQYDYYYDDVAHSNSFGFSSILGFLLFCVFCVVIYYVMEGISKWADSGATYKEPKPKTQAELQKEKEAEERHHRGILWENEIKRKQAIEAKEILIKEYTEDHILDNVHYVLVKNVDSISQSTLDAFTKGYIWGNWRRHSYLSKEEIHKRFHPIVVLGYERGLKEPEIWEKYGKFTG